MSSKLAKNQEPKSYQALLDKNHALEAEVQDLKARLEEAEELKRAISEGDLDALIIPGPEGELVFTLDSADRAYRVLVETMNEGTVTLAYDGTILYCNHRFAELVRIPSQAVVGKPIYQFIEPESRSLFEALLKNETSMSEISLRAEGDISVPVYLSISSLKTEGSPKAWCIVVTDLTEQKKNEEVIAAERLARSIIEQAAEAIIVCDTSGRITRFSNATSRICGCNPTFQRFEDIIDVRYSEGEDAGKKVLPVTSALKGFSILGIEAILELKECQKLHLHLNSGPLRNADGKIIGCVVTLTDITERKQAEEALRYAAEQRRLALEVAQLGTWEYDVASGLTYWDQRCDEIFGTGQEQNYSPNVVMGIVHPEDQQRVCTEVFAALDPAGTGTYDTEYRILRKDGKERVVAVRGRALGKDQEGKPIRFLGTLMDITERKQAEEALRESEKRFKLLSEANSILLLSKEPENVIQTIAGKVMSHLNCDVFFNYVFDEVQGRLHLNAFGGISADVAKEIEWLDIGSAICGCVAQNGCRIVSEDVQHNEDKRANLVRSTGIQAYSCQPLHIRETTIGTLSFGTKSRKIFTKDELALMSTVADQVSVAIERKRSENALKESRKQLEAELADTKLLQSISAELLHEDNVQALYEKIIDAAMQIMHSEYASMQVLHLEHGIAGELQLIASRGFDLQAKKLWEWVGTSSAGSTCGAALRTGQRVIVTDVEKCDYMQGTEDLISFLQNGIHACQSTPLFSRNGEILGMISTHWHNPHEPSERDLRLLDILARQAADLIDRKQAEMALRESEEKYRNLIETANEGIWIVDPEARTTYVNKKMADMLRCTQEEMIGKSAWIFTDEKSNAISKRNMEKRRQDINESHEFKLTRKDGSSLWTLMSAKSIFDKSGKFLGSMSMLTDITERKKVEDELKETLDNLENLVKERTSELEKAYSSLKESERGLAEAQKMAHLGNWHRNLVTDRIYWSDETYRIFGFQPQEFEVTLDEFLSFVHPEDRVHVENNLKKALKGESYSNHYRIISANGTERIVHSQGEVIFDEKNTPIEIRGTIQDVTERKIAEEALDKMDKIRIKEIHHRIKNNLQVICSLLSLEAEKFSDEKMLEAFKESQNRVASMAIIHEELYKGNKSDTLNFAAYLHKFTADLFSSYRLGNNNVSLRMDLEQVYLDMDTAVPLGIIVNELVSNSLKHAFPAGSEGEICISLRRTDACDIRKDISDPDQDCREKGNSRYILRVTDNGKGIPEEIEFPDADSLGLQLVNILVEQINGCVKLKKSPGTDFAILFGDLEK